MKRAWIFFALLIALLAVRNLPWHLDDKDQAKQAFTSFEMIAQRQWWFQHTPTGKVATKPPLAGWISAGVFGVTRDWDLAWRLPGLGCAAVMLVILWRAHSMWKSESVWVAFAGVSAFAFNHFTQRLATLVRTDMLLAFFIFLAGHAVLVHVRRERPWSARDRWLLFAVVLASMLSKGPIAYAFLLPGLVAFWWLRRRARLPNAAWAGWWPWFGPLLVFGAWAGIGIAQSREFYEQVVLVEFLGRFTVGETAVHHNQPVWFYFAQLARGFAPWFVLLLALHFRKDLRTALAADPARLWLACWALGGLLFMSLVPSKRADRIYPVIPPLSLLTAATFATLADRRVLGLDGRRLCAIATTLAAAGTLGFAAYEMRSHFRGDAGALARFGKLARETAAVRPERLAVMSARDEGLLLYMQRTAFTKREDAVARWRRGELGWLVLSEKDLEKCHAQLEPFRELARVRRLPETSSGYALVESPQQK
jgi:4-amino-4-deoxy-L-arabinose transferase-like glycosyltransferase